MCETCPPYVKSTVHSILQGVLLTGVNAKCNVRLTAPEVSRPFNIPAALSQICYTMIISVFSSLIAHDIHDPCRLAIFVVIGKRLSTALLRLLNLFRCPIQSSKWCKDRNYTTTLNSVSEQKTCYNFRYGDI